MASLKVIACRYPLRAADLLLSQFKPINVEVVYKICQILCCEDDEFIWHGARKTVKYFLNQYSLFIDIKEIRIRFYGGPIGRGCWHNGSLWSFILDHVANHILTEGFVTTQALLKKQ